MEGWGTYDVDARSLQQCSIGSVGFACRSQECTASNQIVCIARSPVVLAGFSAGVAEHLAGHEPGALQDLDGGLGHTGGGNEVRRGGAAGTIVSLCRWFQRGASGGNSDAVGVGHGCRMGGMGASSGQASMGREVVMASVCSLRTPLRCSYFAMLRRMQRESGRLFDLASFQAHMADTKQRLHIFWRFVSSFADMSSSWSFGLRVRVVAHPRRSGSTARRRGAFHSPLHGRRCAKQLWRSLGCGVPPHRGRAFLAPLVASTATVRIVDQTTQTDLRILSHLYLHLRLHLH